MKKSRLNLFKLTSMSISVLGILFIIITILVIAGMGIYEVTQSVSSDVGSGASYDQLNNLTTEFDSLENQYQVLGTSVHNSKNSTVKSAYANAKLQLENTNSTINNVNSALTTGLPKSEVDDRINAAQAQILIAQKSLNNVTSMM
jgi:predicted PurR-regulated permease PerM